MKRKIISSLLTVAMVCSLLTGCGSNNAEPTEKESAVSTEETAGEVKTEESEAKETQVEKGALPLVPEGEEATLTIGMTSWEAIEDYKEHRVTKYFEEQTGVNLEFVFFEGEDILTQWALMCTGGEKLPDIMLGFDPFTDDSVVYEYGRDGYLLDLTDLLNEYGHYFWEQYELLSEADQKRIFDAGTDPETGGFYAMPTYLYRDVDSWSTCQAINQKWLDEVGMEAPKNVEELYEVLKAFATQDPNGNGKADEVGMVGKAEGWVADICDYICNAYVYFNMNYPLNVTEGEVWAPFAAEEWREAMIYINKLCSENLLSSMNFTLKDYAECKAFITPPSGDAVVGIWAGYPTLMMEPENPVLEEYVALAPLEDATGKGGYAAPSAAYLEFTTAITCDCEDPALAMRFIDFLNTDGALRAFRVGIEGADYELSEGTTAAGDPAIIKLLENDGLNSWGGVQTGIFHAKNNARIVENDGSWTSKAAVLGGNMNAANMSAKQNSEVVYEFMYNAEEAAIASETKGQLVEYIRDARAQFATGVMDPNDDSDWHGYLDNLNNIGLEEYVKVSQAAYDRTNNK